MRNYTQRYDDIPDDIKKCLKTANVYYEEDYCMYEKKHHHSPIYIYDDSQILVVFICRKYIFRYVMLPTEPFVWSGKGSDSNFMDYVADICQTVFKVDWMGCTGTGALFMEVPKKSVSIPFGSHVIDLTMAQESLWNRIHSKHRNVIRNAEKKNVSIVSGGIELLDDYEKIDEETWERSGQKASTRKHAEEMLQSIPEHVKIYMAYHEGIPQSGAIFLMNEAMSYYMYGASRNKPITGAGNYLQWIAINDAKQAGIKKFSFVGCRINEDKDSKYHGIQRYKERFGGDLIIGKMFKTVFHPGKYCLYKLLASVKAQKIYKDIIDQEYWKWKNED